MELTAKSNELEQTKEEGSEAPLRKDFSDFDELPDDLDNENDLLEKVTNNIYIEQPRTRAKESQNDWVPLA